jgi:hypothetical protein
VTIDVYGAPAELDLFVARLTVERPTAARIADLTWRSIPSMTPGADLIAGRSAGVVSARFHETIRAGRLSISSARRGARWVNIRSSSAAGVSRTPA